MDIAIADVGTLRKQMTLTCPAADVNARADRTLGQYGQQANVKGFRNGKTPKSVLRKRFGAAARSDAIERLIDEVRKGLQDNDLKPIGPFATDEHSDDDDVKHVVSFDVRPEFDLPEPSGIELTEQDTAVGDEEKQEELDALARRSGETAAVTEGKLQKDDTITITGSIKSGDETVRDIHDLNHLVGAYPLFGKDPEEVIAMVADLEVGAELSFDTVLPKASLLKSGAKKHKSPLPFNKPNVCLQPNWTTNSPRKWVLKPSMT